MPLGKEVGLGPYDIAPPCQKGGGAPPQFSAYVYCGQRAGLIKMALDMKVDHGPGHIVLVGEPAPLPKKEQSPANFRSILQRAALQALY